MKRLLGCSVCGLMTLLATMSLRASSPDPAFAPYSGIETRNVFGLKPAPPTSVQPPPPLPRVVLAGIITSLLGNDRALLKEQIAPAASGGTAREIPMILAEGQREGDIEVLILLKNLRSFFEELFWFRGVQPDQSEVRTVKELPAQPLPGVHIQRCG